MDYLNRFSTPLGIVLAVLLLSVPAGMALGEGQKEAEEVTASSQWGGEDLQDLQRWADVYTEQTGVEVSFRSAGEEQFRSTIPLAFESDRAPTDVLAHPWIQLTQRFAREGHLEPLGGLIDEEHFSQSALGYATVNDTIYAVPFRVALKPGFFYKQSFFEEHGLEEPQTYDEFLALLDELQGMENLEVPIASGNGDGWPLTDVTEGFLIGLGGVDLFRGIIDGSVNFTDQAVVDVMEEIARLIEEGYFSEARQWQAQAEALWNENAGIYWNHNTIQHGGFAENPDEVGFFPFPGTNGVTAAINYASVPTYADNLEGARAFVEWIASREGQRSFSEIRGELSARTDVPADVLPSYIRDQQALVQDLQLLPDLDDFIGGEFLEAFRDQLKLLWSEPGRLNEVLNNLAEVAPAASGN